MELELGNIGLEWSGLCFSFYTKKCKCPEESKKEFVDTADGYYKQTGLFEYAPGANGEADNLHDWDVVPNCMEDYGKLLFYHTGKREINCYWLVRNTIDSYGYKFDDIFQCRRSASDIDKGDIVLYQWIDPKTKKKAGHIAFVVSKPTKENNWTLTVFEAGDELTQIDYREIRSSGYTILNC